MLSGISTEAYSFAGEALVQLPDPVLAYAVQDCALLGTCVKKKGEGRSITTSLKAEERLVTMRRRVMTTADWARIRMGSRGCGGSGGSGIV